MKHHSLYFRALCTRHKSRWPTVARKLISAWKAPRRMITLCKLLSAGSDCIMSKAFNHRGWSNVMMGLAIPCSLACSVTKFRVEEIRHIGRIHINHGKEQLKTCSGAFLGEQIASCHSQDGCRVPNSRDTFHRMSRLELGSSACTRTTSLYLISMFTWLGPHGWISTLPVVYIYIYIYLVDKVPQDITSTVPNIYAHMHKLDKKDS